MPLFREVKKMESSSAVQTPYYGVHWSHVGRKWCTQIKQNSKTLYIGIFEDDRVGAVLYALCNYKLNGENARFDPRVGAVEKKGEPPELYVGTIGPIPKNIIDFVEMKIASMATPLPKSEKQDYKINPITVEDEIRLAALFPPSLKRTEVDLGATADEPQRVKRRRPAKEATPVLISTSAGLTPPGVSPATETELELSDYETVHTASSSLSAHRIAEEDEFFNLPISTIEGTELTEDEILSLRALLASEADIDGEIALAVSEFIGPHEPAMSIEIEQSKDDELDRLVNLLVVDSEEEFRDKTAFITDPGQTIQTFVLQGTTSSKPSSSSAANANNYVIKFTMLTNNLSISSLYYNNTHYILGFNTVDFDNNARAAFCREFAEKIIRFLQRDIKGLSLEEARMIGSIVNSINDPNWQAAHQALLKLENDATAQADKIRLAEHFITAYCNRHQKQASIKHRLS